MRKTAPVKRPAKAGSMKEVSVMAWIEDMHGRVLMVKQSRGKKLWALPGGKVKKRESLAMALRRELQEETGLTATRMVPQTFFDRHRKGAVSVLYFVKVRMSKKLAPLSRREIAAVEFKSSLPRNSTPSARHFWQLRDERA